jgi:hypothetical protein
MREILGLWTAIYISAFLPLMKGLSRALDEGETGG